MTTYTFDENIVSDLHKDAYGFRPREMFWNEWQCSTNDQKQVIWDQLIDTMNESMEQERVMQEESLVEFRKFLKSTMVLCNVDWKNALRILIEGDDMSANNEQDFEHYLWKQGISFSKIREIREKFVG
jgi:hypothetical protein